MTSTSLTAIGLKKFTDKHQKMRIILVSSAVVIFTLAPATLAVEDDLELSMQKANIIARQACTISSPDYSGHCQYNVVTIGPQRDMNIHFDLSRKGDYGLTFGGLQLMKNTPEKITMSFTGLAWRSQTVNSKIITGICVMSKPTAPKQEYSCASLDGTYKAVGTGIIEE